MTRVFRMKREEAKSALLELIEEQRAEMHNCMQHSPRWYKAISRLATLTRKWRKTNNLRAA